MNTLQIGANIDSWCTKCKLILAHTIEAISAGEIKRVHCNTCKGKHMYRQNAPGTNLKTPKVKDAKTSSRASRENGLMKASAYSKAIKNISLNAVKIYSVKETFLEGDALKHPTFGVGIVTEDKGDFKIEVLFDTGSKVLIHKRA